MKYSIIASVAAFAASASSLVLPRQNIDINAEGPFALEIVDTGSKGLYKGKYLSSAYQTSELAISAISDHAENVFYFQPRTGQLYDRIVVLTSGEQTDLVANFEQVRGIGQHAVQLDFIQGSEKVTGDVSFDFDKDGYLTHRGQNNVFYVCTDGFDSAKNKVTSLKLVIGNNPFDAQCEAVTLKKH